jgi:heme exporter protein A
VVETATRELAVEIKGLSKSYGNTQVLRDLNLVLPWGQSLSLFGANGSGKTTLIKVLATLSRPEQGVIWVAGFDILRQATAVRASVGLLGHQTLLYQDMTPMENLRFYGRLYGVPGLEERVAEVLRYVGMTERSRQRVHTLSHGMQKRVSLARAILHDPPLLLLDEPESGLDQEALQVLEDIVHSATAKGHAVLLTTHNLERGLALASTFAVLESGRVVSQESVEQTNPSQLRASFFPTPKVSS